MKTDENDSSSEDKESEDFEKINRQDQPVSQRRLDELAWLLEGTSMCAALSVIDSNFYIAINDFFKKTKNRAENQQLEYICDVMEYFRDIANNANNANNAMLTREQEIFQRDQLMQTICKCQINVGTFGRTRVPDAVLSSVVCTQVLQGNLVDSFSSTKEARKFLKDNKKYAHLSFAYGLDIFNRIKKIEGFIKTASKEVNPDFSKITQEELSVLEHLSAFKKFRYFDDDKNNSNLLFFEEEKGVHAELQVLTRIIRAIVEAQIIAPYTTTDRSQTQPPIREIYIGISKRCCLDCHIMLNAANQILAEFGILIKFEGAHDDEVKGWMRPSAIKIPISNTISQTKRQSAPPWYDQLYTRISIAYDESRKRYNQGDSQGYEDTSIGYDTRRPASESEYSLSQISKIDLYERQLQENKESFLRFNVEFPQMLSLSIDLLHVDSFRDLFDQVSFYNYDHDAVLDRFLAIWDELNENRSEKVDKETLLKFLKNTTFSTGEISLFFQNINVERFTYKSSEMLDNQGPNQTEEDQGQNEPIDIQAGSFTPGFTAKRSSTSPALSSANDRLSTQVIRNEDENESTVPKNT